MRNASIDNLRGLASLTVILSHASGYIPFYFFPLPVVYAIAQSAYFAVVLFFVISGFLITTKLLESSNEAGVFSLTAFYVDRIARIGPCLLLFIGFAIVLAAIPIPALAIHWPDLPHKLGCIFTFRFNVCLTEGPGRLPRNWDPIWSLSIEEVFYLCFPALLLLFRRHQSILISGLLILVAIGVFRRYEQPNPWASFANFGHLAVGAITALITFKTRAFKKQKWIPFTAQMIGLVVILCMFWRAGYSTAIDQIIWEPVIICVAAGLYLFGSKRSSVWPFEYRPRLVERFGVLSYEIYLFHMTLLIATSGIGTWIIGLNNPPLQRVLAYMCTGAFLVVMLVGSLFISTYFSRPSDRWVKVALSKCVSVVRRRVAPFSLFPIGRVRP